MTCSVERTLRLRKRNQGHRRTERRPSASIFILTPFLTPCTYISSLQVGFDGNVFCSRWFAFYCCHFRKLSARREHKGKKDENGSSIAQWLFNHTVSTFREER